MPYQHIEEIQSRKGEKIAAFLTLENAIGLIIGALPAYIITASMPFLLRILIVVGAASLGIVLTLDLGGMAGYERLLWRARGIVRLRLQSPIITPAQLVGAAVVVRAGRPLAVGGPVQLREGARVRSANGRVSASTSEKPDAHFRA